MKLTLQERLRVYAAGVRHINTEGSLPLCYRWGSLANMIQFFPNVTVISFPATGTHYEVRSRRGQGVDRLLLTEQVKSTAGAVCAAADRDLPEDLVYQCLYSVDCYGVDTQETALFAQDVNGLPVLAEVLALPAWQLLIWDQRGDNSAWISMLQHRTQQNILTQQLDWRLSSLEELESLFEAMPRDLQSLTLLFPCEEFEEVNTSANAVMNYVDNNRLPELEHLYLRIDFPGDSLLLPVGLTSAQPDTIPRWLNNDLPSKLRDIELTLVYNTPDSELTSQSSSTVSSEAHPEISFIFNLEAPKELILNIRRKLGEEFHLVVETLYHGQDRIKRFQREDYSYLDALLYSPLPEAEMLHHCDSCDFNKDDVSLESDDSSSLISESG